MYIEQKKHNIDKVISKSSQHIDNLWELCAETSLHTIFQREMKPIKRCVPLDKPQKSFVLVKAGPIRKRGEG